VVHRRSALGEVVDACRAREWKLTPIGAATRVFFRDVGVQGAVLRLGTDFSGIELVDDCVSVGAATPVPSLVAAFAKAGWVGLDGLARIPGSFGGALKCEDGIWTRMVAAVTVYSRGKEREVTLDAARRGRSIITGARLRIEVGEPSAVWHAVHASLGGRRAADCRAPQCWWNPLQRRSLRQALVKAGLSGVRLRGITIPDAAPESFANLGGGTAADLALLQRSAIDRVKRATGETLSSRIAAMGGARRTR